jgi:hypothetical protein
MMNANEHESEHEDTHEATSANAASPAARAVDTNVPVASPKPEKRSPLRGILVSLVFGGICGALAVMGYEFGKPHAAFGSAFAALDGLGWSDLLLLPLHFFLVILLHELGHLAGGMARGMRFILLIVGPFRLRRTVSGLKFDWFLRGDTFGGLAATMPVDGRSTPRDFLALALGGPLTSLALAGLALSATYFSDGRLAGHLTILGAMSAMIFVVTAIPMRAGGLLSDGMQALELWRGGTAVEQRNAMVASFAESLSGVRPRDRNAALLERGLALTGKEPLRDVSLWWMAYQVALDRRELDAAGMWIDRVAEGYDAYPSGFRQALACDIAYFAARYRHDLAAATAWYDRAKGGMVEAASRGLTEAAIAWLRGDLGPALAALNRGEGKLGELGDAGAIPLLQDELRGLRAEVEAARAKPLAA